MDTNKVDFSTILLGNESDVLENVSTAFRALTQGYPSFYLDLNEYTLRNSIKVLKRLDKANGTDGQHSNFITLNQFLLNSGGQGRVLLQQFSRIAAPTPDEAKENADIAWWFFNLYFAERSKPYEFSIGLRLQVSKIIDKLKP